MNQQWQPPAWGQQPPAAPAGYPQQPPAAPPPGYGGPPPGYPQQPPQGYPQQPPAAPPGYPGYPPAQAQPQGYGAPPPNYGANPFAGMNSGEGSNRSLPFLGNDSKDGPTIEGDYKFLLRSCVYKPKMQNSQGKAIILALEITESNQPQRPVGMTVSVFIMQDMQMSNINTTAFVAAAHGVDPTQLPKNSEVAPWVDQRAGRALRWDEYALESIGDTNPWAGRKLAASVVNTKKRDGDDFARVDWMPHDNFVVKPRTFAAAAVAPAPTFTPQVPPGPPQTWGQPPQGHAAPPPPAAAWGQQPAAAHPQAPQVSQPPPQWNAQPPQGAPSPAAWGQPPAGAPPGPPQASQPQQGAWGAPPPGGTWNQPPR